MGHYIRLVTSSGLAIALLGTLALACTGWCYDPACPETKFEVCHLDPEGTAQIHFQWKDQDEAWADRKGDVSSPASAYGISVHPCEPKTWADVQSCSDVCVHCI